MFGLASTSALGEEHIFPTNPTAVAGFRLAEGME
jgi:hypothetical protein